MNFYAMEEDTTKNINPDIYGDLLPDSKGHHSFRCEAELVNSKLWKAFHQIGTEMIITKNGRCMFPVLDVCLHGLDDKDQYSVSMEMHLMDGGRWCRSKGAWRATSQARFSLSSPTSYEKGVMHPMGPSPGAMWSKPFKFNNIKLTNNRYDLVGNVMLRSMHKYIPVLRVQRLGPNPAVRYFTFPETEFIAVTAYQNHDIAILKIDNNPYARGFRDGERRQSKKFKRQERISSPDSETPSPQSLPIDCSSSRTSSDSSSNSSSPPPDTESYKHPQSTREPQININPLTMGSPEYYQYLMAEWTRNILHHNISNNFAEMYVSPFLYPPPPQWRPVPTWHTPTIQPIRNDNRPKGSSFTIRALLQ